MRVVLFLFVVLLILQGGCASRWVFVTGSETTEFYLDTQASIRISESSWEVRERVLDKATDRWYLEAEVRYDCTARTFMTLRTREFSEHRPRSFASPIEGNRPVEVQPGSQEEARLEAVCSLLEGG